MPGELLVTFRRAATEGQRDGLRRAVGSRLLRRFEHFDVEHLQLPANISVDQALGVLRGSPDVLSAAPNYLTYVAAPPPPNDPYWLASSPPNLWGMEKINAQAAWTDFGTDSSDVVVGFVDTGTDYNHPDLAANIWSSPSPFTSQGVTCPQGTHGLNTFANPVTCDPMDDSGHGTLTAGIVGAVGNNGIGVVGVNWGVKIMPCKANGPDAVGTSASAIACINFIIDQKVNHGVNVRVINHSWGTYAFDSSVKAAIDAAGTAGILNVAAAGNVGTDNDGPNPFYPASYTSPSIVSVAASDSNDNPGVFQDINPDTGTPYLTNYGATSVDLAAPGTLIVSTFSSPQAPSVQYYVNGGTSYAAPHVSGVAARLASLNPSLTVSELKTILMSSVDQLGQWSGKVASGGRLNMWKALSYHIPPTVVTGARDYDGDGKADIAVYRPSSGIWYVAKSTTNFTTHADYQWGASTDKPAPGDYDGDGKADIAVYRPATGIWYILLSTTNFTNYAAYQWGVSTDVPVPGDYDGDRKTDVAVYRPATGIWYILLSSTNSTTNASYQWGVSTDVPVPADYDGDGKTDVAVYRPATGIWYNLLSTTNSTNYVAYQWGVSSDVAVPADFDGDGKADVAVYRPATGIWYILKSSTNSTTNVAYQWGVSTDVTVRGDYDGDGKTDVAIYRPATGIWYVLLSSTNFSSFVSYQWGVSTDIPALKKQ